MLSAQGANNNEKLEGRKVMNPLYYFIMLDAAVIALFMIFIY